MTAHTGVKGAEFPQDYPMTVHNARPPPLVLVIYPADGGGYGDYLVASGFRVEEAHTGPQGFDRAVMLRPDLVVLDFGLDGDTVARLRREPVTSDIPIIALAALTSLHLQRRGSAARLQEPDA
jgi:two-component system, sensor histidine kinase and response regulator